MARDYKEKHKLNSKRAFGAHLSFDKETIKLVSPVAKKTKVNLEMFTITRFFLLKCIHIGYWNIVSLVGIEKTLGNFLVAN